MFRFDSFKKATDDAKEPSTNTPPSSFLKRIASTDTVLRSRFMASIPMPTTSWGMLAFARLQDDQGELDDVIELLMEDKATLLLPVSIPSHPSAIIDRDFLLDHIYQPQENHVISLSGIHGVFEKEQFVALDIVNMDTADTKKSSLDKFNLDPNSIITPYHPKYNILASHVQLPLKDEKSITVMLIQKPVSKKEVQEWLDKKQETSASLSDPFYDRVCEFIQQFKKNVPKTTDLASTRFLDFMDELHDQMDPVDLNRLDNIESFICTQLYQYLFTNPDGDEAMQDEALESRIAALNLLDLNLTHLGLSVEAETQEQMNQVVKEAGLQLQQLNSILTAEGKLKTLVQTHQAVVDAIETVAQKKHAIHQDAEVVQEMKHVMESIEEEKEALSDLHSGANADVLLPILIFTVAKSNPTHFLSNLKFIQRYRRPDALTGQASYCLTNMVSKSVCYTSIY
ncbi:hypothetical protein BD560DRAFT_395304 [Blakeslea trispora]|nr:hypothetical protein BD560DRAFT_395304 [Blakeslea trispora]